MVGKLNLTNLIVSSNWRLVKTTRFQSDQRIDGWSVFTASYQESINEFSWYTKVLMYIATFHLDMILFAAIIWLKNTTLQGTKHKTVLRALLKMISRFPQVGYVSSLEGTSIVHLTILWGTLGQWAVREGAFANHHGEKNKLCLIGTNMFFFLWTLT